MEEIIAATNGTYFLENSTAHTSLRLQAIQVNTDCVFTTLTIVDRNTATSYSALAVKSSSNPMGQNLAARTVSAGSIIFAPLSGYISAVTMSSGSAIGVNTNQ